MDIQNLPELIDIYQLRDHEKREIELVKFRAKQIGDKYSPKIYEDPEFYNFHLVTSCKFGIFWIVRKFQDKCSPRTYTLKYHRFLLEHPELVPRYTKIPGFLQEFVYESGISPKSLRCFSEFNVIFRYSSGDSWRI